MDREGGIGVIHRNNTPEDQAAYVKKVKRAENEMIVDPICLTPKDTLLDVQKVMEENNISGVPIVDSFENMRLAGIITLRDIRFEEDFSVAISEKMRKGGEVIKAPIGTTMEEAEQVLAKYKIEKLPIVDEEGTLKGLIHMKDILQRRQLSNAVKD